MFERWPKPESNKGADNKNKKDDEQGNDGEHHQHHRVQSVLMVFAAFLALLGGFFLLQTGFDTALKLNGLKFHQMVLNWTNMFAKSCFPPKKDIDLC